MTIQKTKLWLVFGVYFIQIYLSISLDIHENGKQMSAYVCKVRLHKKHSWHRYFTKIYEQYITSFSNSCGIFVQLSCSAFFFFVETWNAKFEHWTMSMNKWLHGPCQLCNDVYWSCSNGLIFDYYFFFNESFVSHRRNYKHNVCILFSSGEITFYTVLILNWIVRAFLKLMMMHWVCFKCLCFKI